MRGETEIMIRFGPAGSSDSFHAMGYKTMLQMPQYLEQFGLMAFEYQCGRGVRVNEDVARKFGEISHEKGISISLHAPYYISLSSPEPDKREKSIDYIMQSARAVDWMGGERIIVHSGSASKMTREEALALAVDTLILARKALDDAGYGHINICPETMGKVGQLGTLEEVLDLCRIDERMIPCIDMGHLYARTFGETNGYEAYDDIFRNVEQALGTKRMRGIHMHFSKIAFTEKGGEKMHLKFEDEGFGPDFEPLSRVLFQRKCEPTVICESAGTQAEDAASMMHIYEETARTSS